MTQQPLDMVRYHERMAAISERDPQFALGSCRAHGVEMGAYVNAPRSLRDLITLAAESHGDKTFMVYEGETYTYTQVLDQSRQLANALWNEFGVRAGDRVAIAMRNMPEWIIAFNAIQFCGAIAVALNSWWKGEELSYGLDDSGATLAFVDDRRLEEVKPRVVDGQLRVITARCSAQGLDAATDWKLALAGQPADTRPDLDPAGEDPATILYTSGSTGVPKGVLADNRGIINFLWYGVHIGAAAMDIAADDAKANGETLPVSPYQPATLLTVPLFHVSGCLANFLAALVRGDKLVMMYRWDGAQALALIESERISSITAVPTMIADLLNSPDLKKYDLSSLGLINAGGAATAPERIRQMNEQLGAVTQSVGYGMTETNAAGTLIGGADLTTRPGSVGPPVFGVVEIQLVDDDGQIYRPEQPGQRGEVWIRSVCNMREYWNKPEATAQTLTQGWVRSGDLGEFDEDGLLYIVGRIKEIIIRGGENISCNEVESAIYEHPAALEACAVGVPDSRLGEKVVALVALQPGEVVSEAELKDFLATRLAGFKIPERLEIRNELLPRLATGKFDRVAIREALA